MNANQQPTHRPQSERPPSLMRRTWNLAGSLASFLADGCKALTKEEFQSRLKVCETCDQRRGNRCLKCGCRLSLKARGRAFQCPLNKWPTLTDETADS
ncbi:MAG: hypothetical protein HYV60_01500 [Planctomycetia bacterium]|nr:hypothetical protein [Planctomycetia bacterium]